VAVSQALHANGSVGRTVLLRYRRSEAWPALVSFLGLPADPTWSDYVLGRLEKDERVEDLDRIGCEPVVVRATADEVLAWVAEGLQSNELALPESNGPIAWQQLRLTELLQPQTSS
jgi:hypothetical protein